MTTNAATNGRVATPTRSESTPASPPTIMLSNTTMAALQNSAPALNDLGDSEARVLRQVTNGMPVVFSILQQIEQALVQGDNAQAMTQLRSLLAPGQELDSNIRQIEQYVGDFTDAQAVYQRTALSTPLDLHTALDAKQLAQSADALDRISDTAGELSALLRSRVRILQPQQG